MLIANLPKALQNNLTNDELLRLCGDDPAIAPMAEALDSLPTEEAIGAENKRQYEQGKEDGREEAEREADRDIKALSEHVRRLLDVIDNHPHTKYDVLEVRHIKEARDAV